MRKCKYFLILTEYSIYKNETVRCSFIIHPPSVEKQDIVPMFLLIHHVIATTTSSFNFQGHGYCVWENVSSNLIRELRSINNSWKHLKKCWLKITAYLLSYMVEFLKLAFSDSLLVEDDVIVVLLFGRNDLLKFLIISTTINDIKKMLRQLQRID